MKKYKIITIFTVLLAFFACLLIFGGCSKNQVNAENDSVVQDSIEQDAMGNRISFGKKYYWLDYNGYTENEYYTFNVDGNATYNHIMKEGQKITFHQVINFKWTYAGEGDCILVHNGTQIIKGTQDDAFGIARVIHVANDAIYWSAFGENTYFVCEDFINQAPNYGKLISNN